jgi:hypothetical protein
VNYQAIWTGFELSAAAGIAMAAASIAMYCARTRDLRQPMLRLWMPRALFTRREYLLNRSGFWLALASLFVLRVVLYPPGIVPVRTGDRVATG